MSLFKIGDYVTCDRLEKAHEIEAVSGGVVWLKNISVPLHETWLELVESPKRWIPKQFDVVEHSESGERGYVSLIRNSESRETMVYYIQFFNGNQVEYFEWEIVDDNALTFTGENLKDQWVKEVSNG